MTPHEQAASQLEAVVGAAVSVVALQRACGRHATVDGVFATAQRRVEDGTVRPWADWVDAMLSDLEREHAELVAEVERRKAAARGEP